MHAAKITVHIIRASNVPKADKFSESDPYVKITIGTQSDKTKVISDEPNPEWNEKKSFFVTKEVEQAREKNVPLLVKLEVFDYDPIGANDKLGEYTVELKGDLSEYETDEGKKFHFEPLQKTKMATISFNLKTQNISTI